MATRAIIEVVASYKDEASRGLESTSKSADKAKKKLEEAAGAAGKLGKTKAQAKLDVDDKATNKIKKAIDTAKSFASKTFKSSLAFTDKASSIINKVTGAARTFAGKTFNAAVKIKDYATAPLTKIKNALFNIKTLIATITAGMAAKQFILNPINLADAYSSTKIGFSTLLGDAKGQQMMDAMDEFAKKTPFKTSGVISNAQKMMAYGWDPEQILTDMEIIGNAAAATGKMDQGLESIVYALSEIKSKGKLSTQELNQLASAGIKAKAYLAEGLGYGTSDEGMMKLSKDLEGGAIGANQAVQLILQGMKEFDGMMDRTANETVEGLKSQIADAFEINIFRRWGQGLQDGAKKGLGSLVELLDSSDTALAKFGDTLYQIGETASQWVAEKMGDATEAITELMDTAEFKDASLGGKAKMIWDAVIGDPFSEWWDSKGKKLIASKAGEFGKDLGSGITKGLLALLGIDVTDMAQEGVSIGASFAQGFAEGFDGSAITEALLNAIKNVWNGMPTWAKILIGGYAVGKTVTGVNAVLGGIGGIVGTLGKVPGVIGSAGTAMVGGSGIMGGLASTGYALTGGAAGSTLAGGTAALLGAGGIIGGVAGGTATVKGVYDIYKSIKAYRAGDQVEANARGASGGTALGGVATGAAIGSIFGPVGTLVGTGIGGVAGLIAGSKWAEKIRKDAEAAKYESKEMQEAIKDTEKSAEELSAEFEKAVGKNMRDHFGDMYLSLEEISKIAEKITFGDKAEDMQKFETAVTATASSFANLQSASAALDKWNWKAGLGVKFDENEIASIKESVDNYMSAAKQFVEDSQYEFTTAVSLLVDVNSDEGKGILNTANEFYSGLQSQLDTLGEQLSGKVDIALQDGVITLDEQAEITNLQNQIAEITNKIAQAETEAEFEAIKIKFGDSKLDSDSFANLQSELQSKLEEATQTQDNALTASIAKVKLQLNEGAISQEEYDAQIQALTEGYRANIESINAEVANVQLELIGEAYSDVLGEDAKEKLSSALTQSLKQGIKPAEWSTDDARKFLNTSQLSEESAAALSTMLQGVSTSFQTSLDTAFNKTFKTDTKVSVTAKYSLANPTATLSFTGGGTGTATVSGSIVSNAAGDIIGGRTLSWLGEEGPEAVIPLGSKHNKRAVNLWKQAGEAIGAGTSQGTQLNMGGLTININGSGNNVQDVEKEAEEMAERVAAVFNRVFKSQFENMPAKAGV